MAEESPSVFFSQDLCARYFTYTRNGETHFVLYDDADTLSQKLRTGAARAFPRPSLAVSGKSGTFSPAVFPETGDEKTGAVPDGTARFFHQ